MIFKVDFAKAYDSIRWDFLDDVLISFGFGSKWRSWIRGSLSSGTAYILVNGSPTPTFHFHRGLKQGDPLAPFLFLLIMESLHLSFSRAVEGGIFTNFRVDHSITLSHLFYADDVVFIGMSINIQNSHLLGVGIPDNCDAEAAKSIGCSIMKAHFQYLGILVGDKGLGRGLGVLSFYALNRALLFKWVWRYLSHDNSLWSRVISAIHGLNGQVLSTAFNSTWSSIINKVNSLKDKGVDLISYCKIRVGKGTCTSFWNDLWIGDSLLKLSFPRLYALKEKKHISVADKMCTSISLSFRRPVRGGVESQQHDHLSDVQKLIGRWWNLDFQSFDSYDGWLSWFKSIRLAQIAVLTAAYVIEKYNVTVCYSEKGYQVAQFLPLVPLDEIAKNVGDFSVIDGHSEKRESRGPHPLAGSRDRAPRGVWGRGRGGSALA
nr:RNA-directed DNA polymerase, eukaryota [Tanacetum cinerariifolium]